MLFTKLSINPPVFAHRGASRYAPENTFAAFKKAKELGIQWLEFDVMLSSDNKLVVIHDDTLERTTNFQGYVNSFTYEKLNSFDAGSWFNPQFNQEKIPLLSDVLDWMLHENMSANIEIKALPSKEALTAEIFIELLKHYGSFVKTRLLISSFSLDILYQFKKLNLSYPMGFLMDEWDPHWEKICDELNCSSVNPNQEILTSANVELIKATGRSVFTYTVNEYERAKELFSWGVDAVFSDCPDKIIHPL